MAEKDSYFNSEFLMRLIVRNKIPLLIVAVVAALLAVLFTSPVFVTPLYESKVVLYPTSGNSISKTLLSSTFQSKKDMLEFGEVEQTEQMLQVLNSNRIRDKVIERYQLMDHYGIMPDSRYPYTKLTKLFDSRLLWCIVLKVGIDSFY